MVLSGERLAWLNLSVTGSGMGGVQLPQKLVRHSNRCGVLQVRRSAVCFVDTPMRQAKRWSRALGVVFGGAPQPSAGKGRKRVSEAFEKEILAALNSFSHPLREKRWGTRRGRLCVYSSVNSGGDDGQQRSTSRRSGGKNATRNGPTPLHPAGTRAPKL